MHAFKYLLGEPSKSLFAQRIVRSHAHDDIDDYEHVSLSTFSLIVHRLLDTYAAVDVVPEADAALRNLTM